MKKNLVRFSYFDRKEMCYYITGKTLSNKETKEMYNSLKDVTFNNYGEIQKRYTQFKVL